MAEHSAWDGEKTVIITCRWIDLSNPNQTIILKRLALKVTNASISVSPPARAHWRHTSWRLLVLSGAAPTRTRATTPRVTSPPTMRRSRCSSQIASLASSWSPPRWEFIVNYTGFLVSTVKYPIHPTSPNILLITILPRAPGTTTSWECGTTRTCATSWHWVTPRSSTMR